MSTGTNTPNLGLHNWQGGDKVLRSEFNDNFTAIDTWAGAPIAGSFSSSGLTGAQNATRYVGGTGNGPPTTGTFKVGDWVVDYGSATIWVCQTAGTPGTWAKNNGLTGYEFSVGWVLGQSSSSGTAVYNSGYSFLVNNVSSSITYYFEAVISSNVASATAYAELWDLTTNAPVSNSTVSTTSTLYIPVRSAAVTLTAGHRYTMAEWSPAGTVYVNMARVVGVR